MLAQSVIRNVTLGLMVFLLPSCMAESLYLVSAEGEKRRDSDQM